MASVPDASTPPQRMTSSNTPHYNITTSNDPIPGLGPRGSHFEDLPPPYNFPSSATRSSGTATNVSTVEAHTNTNERQSHMRCEGTAARQTLGRKMSDWSEQVRRQAVAMGKQFGQRTEQWASAYSAGGGGYNPPARPQPAPDPSSVEPSDLPLYDHPPSYECSATIFGHDIVVSRTSGGEEGVGIGDSDGARGTSLESGQLRSR